MSLKTPEVLLTSLWGQGVWPETALSGSRQQHLPGVGCDEPLEEAVEKVIMLCA